MFTPSPEDLVLLRRAAAWSEHGSIDELTQPVLADISAREGIDFATALLYHRLLQRESVRAAMAEAQGQANGGDPLIGVVPGAFYKEYPFTGADGQRVLDLARRAGLRAERVPLDSFGHVADNARMLVDWLRRHEHEEVRLVSLSKGGTDVACALSLPDADRRFANVSAWLNLSGIVQGTALADWLLARPMRCALIRLFAWWRGYRFGVVHDIRRADALVLDMPAHVRVVHVIGFPLRRHLRGRLAQRGHRRLEDWGPNDGGGILLADAVRWPGTLIPLWGVDHYLPQEAFDVATLVTRLLTDISYLPLAA